MLYVANCKIRKTCILDRRTQHQGASLKMHACNSFAVTAKCKDITEHCFICTSSHIII